MAEVEALCDRIAVLNHGEIVFCGTANELTETMGKKYFIHIKTNQGSRTVETDNISNTLLAMLKELKQNDLELLDIKVDRGSLEEHFLEIARRDSQ
jgi:ABC-2 type transport system ATP-binding protein